MRIKFICLAVIIATLFMVVPVLAANQTRSSNYALPVWAPQMSAEPVLYWNYSQNLTPLSFYEQSVEFVHVLSRGDFVLGSTLSGEYGYNRAGSSIEVAKVADSWECDVIPTGLPDRCYGPLTFTYEAFNKTEARLNGGDLELNPSTIYHDNISWDQGSPEADMTETYVSNNVSNCYGIRAYHGFAFQWEIGGTMFSGENLPGYLQESVNAGVAGIQPVVPWATCAINLKVYRVTDMAIVQNSVFHLYNASDNVLVDIPLPSGVGQTDIIPGQSFSWNATAAGYISGNRLTPQELDNDSCGYTLSWPITPIQAIGGNTTVNFNVYDPNICGALCAISYFSAEISGAQVGITGPSNTYVGYTNDYGVAAFNLNSTSAFSWTVSKTGYETQTGNFTLSGEGTKIVLVPLSTIPTAGTPIRTMIPGSGTGAESDVSGVFFNSAGAIAALVILAIIMGLIDIMGGQHRKRR